MIALIIASALAVTYLWALAAFLHTPVIRPVQRWLRRGWRAPLVGCPWCFGFWASLVVVVILHAASGDLDPVGTPLVVLATAAAAGLIGSNLTPGADLEGNDE